MNALQFVRAAAARAAHLAGRATTAHPDRFISLLCIVILAALPLVLNMEGGVA